MNNQVVILFQIITEEANQEDIKNFIKSKDQILVVSSKRYKAKFGNHITFSIRIDLFTWYWQFLNLVLADLIKNPFHCLSWRVWLPDEFFVAHAVSKIIFKAVSIRDNHKKILSYTSGFYITDCNILSSCSCHLFWGESLVWS